MIYNITEIEVHYAETGKMDVIYHRNYTVWFEVARLDYISRLGFSYADMEKQGIISPMTDLDVNYKKSVFYLEKVKVKTWVGKYSRLRSTYKYEIFNEKGELATTGPTELICIRGDTFKPVRLGRCFPGWYEAYGKVRALNNEGKIVEIMGGIDSL